MKPTGTKNYGSIPHLSNSKLGVGDHFIHKGQEHIITTQKRDKRDIVFSHEKYDGSNVGIAKINGKIVALTRSGYLADTSPYKQHHLFSNYVHSHEGLFYSMLHEGERIVGEWLLQAHGLKYKINGNPIIFFDYFNSKNERLLQSQINIICSKYELERPRLLSLGDSRTVGELIPILNEKTKKFESEEMPEGIVFRVERSGKVDFLAKWVRPDFEAGKYIINVEEKDLIWNI